KLGNVVFYPSERGDHVLEAVDAGTLSAFPTEIRMRQESERADAVGGAYQNDALLCELSSVIQWDAGHSSDEPAAIYPDHDRELLALALCRGPDIQIQAVFAEVRRSAHHRGQCLILYAAWRKSVGLFYSVPRTDRLRRFPAKVADGWRGKGNALKRGHIAVYHTLQFSAGDRCFGYL